MLNLTKKQLLFFIHFFLATGLIYGMQFKQIIVDGKVAEVNDPLHIAYLVNIAIKDGSNPKAIEQIEAALAAGARIDQNYFLGTDPIKNAIDDSNESLLLLAHTAGFNLKDGKETCHFKPKIYDDYGREITYNKKITIASNGQEITEEQNYFSLAVKKDNTLIILRFLKFGIKCPLVIKGHFQRKSLTDKRYISLLRYINATDQEARDAAAIEIVTFETERKANTGCCCVA